MSGTNVHAILEQAPEAPVVVDADQAQRAGKDLLVFPVCSTSVEELRTTAANLADWVESAGDELSLPDLGYTLSRRRGHRPMRTSVIAEDRGSLIEQLRQVADGDEPYQAAVGHDDRGPVWIFSGQGSQWASMGTGLLATEPVFAAKIAEIEPLIAAESNFSVTEAMTAEETVEGIHRVQPTIFAVQVAMAATMQSYGVQPGAVIGHSLGEVAAAVVSGALSLEDGVKVICRRSLLCLRLAGGGAMASVEMPAQQVREELEQQGIEDVVVAVVASPKSTVIGGATDTVRKIVAGWEAREIMAREVNVDVASHSPQVDPILDELADMLSDITPMAPEVPYYSATSFDPREQPYCDADYWVDNLRHTVRFSAAVQTALEDGFRVFGELAPHPLLIRAIDQTAGTLDISVAALAGMRRGQEVPERPGRFPRRSVLGRRAGGLLGSLPGRPAGRRTAAHLDAPQPGPDRRRRRPQGARRAPGGCASAAGLARPPAGGARAARLGRRGRYRRASVAGRPPDQQRRGAARCGVLRDGAGRRPHRVR